MLDQVLELFEIKPDYDLNIMKPGQTLSEITGEILKSIEPILKIIGRIWFWSMVIPQPHFLQLWLRIISVLLWAMWRLACAQVIFTPHGLREANRKLTGVLANFHFAPTEISRNNLLKEGVAEKSVHVTGIL